MDTIESVKETVLIQNLRHRINVLRSISETADDYIDKAVSSKLVKHYENLHKKLMSSQIMRELVSEGMRNDMDMIMNCCDMVICGNILRKTKAICMESEYPLFGVEFPNQWELMLADCYRLYSQRAINATKFTKMPEQLFGEALSSLGFQIDQIRRV
jgi:hypothetical protein